MLSSDRLVGNYSGVACLEGFWVHEVVHICGHELSFVVRRSVADNNLR